MSKQSTRITDLLPLAATASSIFACYGTIAVLALLSLMGLSIAVNDGVWAGAISAFAVLALLGIVYGHRRHGRVGPVGLAFIGSVLILWVMYGEYNRALEFTGFATLVAAALWDWRAKKRGFMP